MEGEEERETAEAEDVEEGMWRSEVVEEEGVEAGDVVDEEGGSGGFKEDEDEDVEDE